NPPELRCTRAQIQRKRESPEDDLGAGQELIATLPRACRASTMAEVALHTPLRPGLPHFVVEPPPCIDHLETRIDRCDTGQSLLGHGHDHQDVHDCINRGETGLNELATNTTACRP